MFLPKLVEKVKPIFKLLKGSKKFEWHETWEKVIQNIKRDIISTSMLLSPSLDSTLKLYLLISSSTLSLVLVYEEKEKQNMVYLTSWTLHPMEEQYQIIERLTLALVFFARRLSHYFCSFNIIVWTHDLTKQVLQKLKLDGRMTSWSVKLSEFRLNFKVMVLMKAQFLANFLVELPKLGEKHDWSLSVNESSNKKGNRTMIILEGLDNIILDYSIHFSFDTSSKLA